MERASGRLVARAGVNRVLAMSLAQWRLGDYELVTSAEPWVQCFGAPFWAGLSGVVRGARSADAEAAGFDEGPKPGNWAELLTARGIAVTIRDYAAAGGPIYNPDAD